MSENCDPYILGLIKAKTQEGQEGGELGNIVTPKLQIGLVTDQALSQACSLVHERKTDLSELS